jgi:hypothetical protein
MFHESSNRIWQSRHGQELLNDVVRLFSDLLAAGGATKPMIQLAMSNAICNAVENRSGTVFTELGNMQRDCMEVMCTWRRETSLVDSEGTPIPLNQGFGSSSFDALCKLAGCEHTSEQILRALVDFGAVSIDSNGMVVSETPTFLLGRAASVGRLATDGLLKQLEGYLRVVHRNVCSVTGSLRARFERACTVSVAIELEPIFDQLVRERGQVFVDSVDEWLERHAGRASTSGRYRELGAGAYFIDLGDRSARTHKG